MTGYQSKKAAALDKLAVDRAQVEHWLQALKDIDALHHPAEPESVDAQKALDDMGQALAQPAQRPWVDLTPEEILDLFDLKNVYGSKWVEFARAVEAKLREKNT